MYILGISCFYHDAAASLLKDGEIVAAAQEERFTRKKHDDSFPTQAINYCFKEAGIDISQIDYIGFYDKPLLKFERILESYIDNFPKSWRAFIAAMSVWLTKKLWIKEVIKNKLQYTGEIYFINHHLSHAASSFFVSPFETSAILTVDAVGEWATATFGVGKGKEIKISKE
ncbi:MAG TPA: carbamoyltransferase N-terminal domain-containing protein, partial [Candidatus Parcubacteria bacterium]|nr:carbamoyltransferase N-terminal domain-containing protein [Candidatus Parcubacteria bacterium]